MSDTMGAAEQFAAAFQGSESQGTETETAPEQSTQQEQQQSYSPYAQNFLKDVPEDQRAIVGEHLKRWDAGFTRYSQQVMGELNQYKQLGDLQQLQQAQQYFNQLVNNPHSVVELLIQNGFGPRQAQQIAQQATQGQTQPQQDLFKDLPEPIRNKFETVDQMQQQFEQTQRAMGLIANWINQQEQSSQDQAADRQLDLMLNQARTQYGDFDEQYVLAQIVAGRDIDSAIQAYQQAVQQAVDARRAPAPPQIVSGSSLPAIKTPLETPDDRNNALVAALKGLGLGT